MGIQDKFKNTFFGAGLVLRYSTRVEQKASNADYCDLNIFVFTKIVFNLLCSTCLCLSFLPFGIKGLIT